MHTVYTCWLFNKLGIVSILNTIHCIFLTQLFSIENCRKPTYNKYRLQLSILLYCKVGISIKQCSDAPFIMDGWH